MAHIFGYQNIGFNLLRHVSSPWNVAASFRSLPASSKELSSEVEAWLQKADYRV